VHAEGQVPKRKDAERDVARIAAVEGEPVRARCSASQIQPDPITNATQIAQLRYLYPEDRLRYEMVPSISAKAIIKFRWE